MKNYIQAFIDSLVDARMNAPIAPQVERPDERWLHLATQGRVARLRWVSPAPAAEIRARVSRAEREARAGS